MIDIDDLDFTDPQQLQNISKEIALADRQVLIETLKTDLPIPLPEDLEGQAKAISGRAAIFEQIEKLNNKLEILDDLTPMGASSLIDLPLQDRKWLLYPLLPESEVTLCTGQGGVGKSFLSIQIACLLAAGHSDSHLSKKEIFGMTAYHYFVQSRLKPEFTNPKPVVFASYEDNINEINRRTHTILEHFDWAGEQESNILSNFHPVTMRQHGPIWAPDYGKHIQTRSNATQAAKQLKGVCKKHKAKLLIIDPLSAGFYGDENSKAEAYAFINFWAGWAEQTEIAVMINAHLPKGKEARRSGYSGAAAWEGAVRSLFTLDRFDLNEDQEGERKKEGNKNLPRKWYIALKGIKGNYAKIAKQEIPMIRGDYGWLEHTGETELTKAQEKAHEKHEKGETHSTRNSAQEDTDDDDENPYANIQRR